MWLPGRPPVFTAPVLSVPGPHSHARPEWHRRGPPEELSGPFRAARRREVFCPRARGPDCPKLRLFVRPNLLSSRARARLKFMIDTGSPITTSVLAREGPTLPTPAPTDARADRPRWLPWCLCMRAR